MSNEEAVKMLRTMQRTVYLGNRKFEDAIECAIKALSEPLQPWEVLVAQSVLSQPEPHWIPVTERLPETELQHPGHGIGDYLKSDMVAVSGDFDYGDKVWIACYCDDLDGKTYWSDMDANTLYDVIAWMPLPEPYKGVTDGND